MKRIRSSVFAVLACATAVTLSAQTPPAGGAQTPSPSASADNKVTVTGCLDKASASPTGTSGAGAGAASASAKFVLNSATAGSSSPSAAPSGTAGTSGASKAPIASSYSLDGDDAKLTPHVGHKVEITGTVDRAMGKSDSPAGGSAAAAPKLKVDAVKMIAASCTP